MLCTCVILPVLKPASVKVVPALAVVIPVTSGTLTSPPPVSNAPSAQATATAAARTTNRPTTPIQARLRGFSMGSTTCAERSTRSMSAWNCAAVPRAPGSLASARVTICDNAGGTAGLSSCGGCTTPSSCSCATARPSAPSNTWRPVSSR